jgi:hypothetical protein
LKKSWWESFINLRSLQERGREVMSFVNQYQIGVSEHTKALEKEMTLEVQEREKEMSLKADEHEKEMSLKVQEHERAMSLKADEHEWAMSLKVQEHEWVMSLKADDHIEAMSIKDKELDTLKNGLATALELHSKFETYSKSSKEIIVRLAEISPTITHHLSSFLM